MSWKEERRYPETTLRESSESSAHQAAKTCLFRATLHHPPPSLGYLGVFLEPGGRWLPLWDWAISPDARHWVALPQVRVSRGGASKDWRCLV